jgi:hypothetical protein
MYTQIKQNSPLSDDKDRAAKSRRLSTNEGRAVSALSAAEGRRFDTWIVRVAEVLTGERGIPEGRKLRFPGLTGLLIDTMTGAWRVFGAGVGGRHAVHLVMHLKTCTYAEALDWATAWLAANPGDGSCPLAESSGDDELHREVNKALAEKYLAGSKSITPESSSGLYLAKIRSLKPPYDPELIRHLQNARVGEDALLAIALGQGRVVGIQLTYLAPDGSKSLVKPLRRYFALEQTPGFFEISRARSSDGPRRTLIAEGLEDGLTLQRLGRPERLIALPGIRALSHYPAEAGEEITIVRDGDPMGSPADRDLWTGVDALITAGATVKVTQTPEGEDANSIWKAKGCRTAPLSDLLASAVDAKLSAGGALRNEIRRLAGLAEDQYQAEVSPVARKLKASADYIRKEVRAEKRRRLYAELQESDGEGGVRGAPPAPKWTGPPPVLAELLSAIMAAIGKYLVVSKAQLVAMTLWIAASHLVHSEKVALRIFPKLAFQSKDPASGKTTASTIVWNLVPNGQLLTYPSGALLIRLLGSDKMSVCLDELQYSEDKNLKRVIDASHLRLQAKVPVLEPTPSGGWIPVWHNTWAPMCLSYLGELGAAQRSRSIVIVMKPKLPRETCQRLKADGTAPEFADLKAQLEAWADSVNEWKDIELPESIYSRSGDNWNPMVYLAERASPEWRQMALEAAAELLNVRRGPTITERLLTSLWRIYQPKKDAPPTPFIASTKLVEKLVNDRHEEWNTAGSNRGAITTTWLGRKLNGLLDPPGERVRKDHAGPRGYAFVQLTDAFARYVGDYPEPLEIELPEESIAWAPPSQPGPPGPKSKTTGKSIGLGRARSETQHGPKPSQPGPGPGAGHAGPGSSGDVARDFDQDISDIGAVGPSGPSSPGGPFLMLDPKPFPCLIRVRIRHPNPRSTRRGPLPHMAKTPAFLRKSEMGKAGRTRSRTSSWCFTPRV